MKNRSNSTYLAIALTTKCNYSCFYCKSSGESLAETSGTIEYETLKRIIKVAYQVGINSFRITGGEPTMVPYLQELIQYIFSLGNDTRIRLNTNGYKLSEFTELFEQYKKRVDIIISVDSLHEYISGIHFPKYLSFEIEDIVKGFVKRKISTRFNIVVTKYNIEHLPELIEKSLELGVNLKLLDLHIQDEYLGTRGKLQEGFAHEFWEKQYVQLGILRPVLEEISDEFQQEHHQWNSYGIPRSAYFKNGQMIQVKDSTKGAYYSKTCAEKCPFYHLCQDGMFSPLLSANEVIHFSNCLNKDLYFDLKGESEENIAKVLKQMLSLLEVGSVQNNMNL